MGDNTVCVCRRSIPDVVYGLPSTSLALYQLSKCVQGFFKPAPASDFYAPVEACCSKSVQLLPCLSGRSVHLSLAGPCWGCGLLGACRASHTMEVCAAHRSRYRSWWGNLELAEFLNAIQYAVGWVNALMLISTSKYLLNFLDISIRTHALRNLGSKLVL